MRSILVLLSSLAYLSTAAFAAVPVSDAVISAAAGTRSAPAIAAGDGGYLAVWADNRSGESQIVAARIDSTGNVLDPTGITVAGVGYAPDVEWSGESYLVSYACGDLYKPAICVATVSLDGTVRGSDSNPIAVGFEPSLAWNGTNFLLAAWTSTINSRITLVLLDREGTPVKPPIVFGEFAGHIPRVASNGDDFYLVWKVPFGIRGQAISRSGDPVDAPAYVAGPGERHFNPDVASDGTDYVAVWDHVVVAPIVQLNVEGRAIAANGQFKSDARIVAYGHTAAWLPSIAWTGSDYFVSYTSDAAGHGYFFGRGGEGDVRGALIARDGSNVRGSRLSISDASHQSETAVAWNGAQGVVVWSDEAERLPRGTATQIRAQRVDPLGLAISDQRLVSRSVTEQQKPAIARGSRTNLAVWSEILGDDHRRTVFAGRLTKGLARLDGRGLALRTTTADQQWPAASFNGSSYLVVWNEHHRESGESRVYAARVDEEGRRLDAGAILISADAVAAPVAVAFDGTNHLIAWTSGDSKRIVVTRVSPGGAVLDPPRTISVSGSLRDINPAISWTGEYYYVVWNSVVVPTCQILCPSEGWGIHGLPVTRDGFPVGEPTRFSSPDASAPAIASSGSESIVIWTNSNRLMGSRVLQNGLVVGREGIVITHHATPSRPSLIWNGDAYVVAWEVGYPDYDIVSLRLGPDLIAKEPVRKLIGSLDRETMPALADDGGRFVVLYQRYASEPEYQGVSRVFALDAREPRRRAARR